MDPMTLASIAAPFVAKGAEAFSKSAGEKLGAKVGELCQAVTPGNISQTWELARRKGCIGQFGSSFCKTKRLPRGDQVLP